MKGSQPRPQRTPAANRLPIAMEANEDGRGPTPTEGSGLAAEDLGRSHPLTPGTPRFPAQRLLCLPLSLVGTPDFASGLQRASLYPRRPRDAAPPCCLRRTPGGRHTSCLATSFSRCPQTQASPGAAAGFNCSEAT